MPRLTAAELKTAINSYVAASKIATSYTPEYNLSGLLKKIGKIYTIDQEFIDKLSKFDAEFLEYGKTVEEWSPDLLLPEDVATADDVEVVRSHYGTNAPVKYSYELGDKVFAHTVKQRDLEKGVNNADQLSDLLYAEQRRLTNSAIIYRYAAKRQLAGRFADAAANCMNDTGATLWVAGTSQSEVGKKFKNAGTGTRWATLVKPYASTANLTFDAAVAAGYLMEYNTVTKIAAPTNTATGEAFIKKVKELAEVASDMSEGHSINGKTLGVTDLTILVKQGYMPSVEVDTQAGAFNGEKLAIPAEVIVLPDFGTMTNTDVYAIALDSRAMRLFPTNDKTGEFVNDYKDFVNFFKHFDATAVYSCNAFVHVFKNV